MGTGRPSWLVMLGPHRCLHVVVLGPRLPFVVLGPRHCWWVVLVPRRQLQVVLLGPRRFLWVDGLGAGCIVCGWWWCALVVPFVNGGGGAPSSVFAWPPSPLWWSCRCSRERVVGHSCLQMLHPLSSCIGVLHHFHVLSSRVLVVMCPHHCHVSSPCRCPLPSSLLSRDVVAVPSL